jgi:hypothetical protein
MGPLNQSSQHMAMAPVETLAPFYTNNLEELAATRRGSEKGIKYSNGVMSVEKSRTQQQFHEIDMNRISPPKLSVSSFVYDN